MTDHHMGSDTDIGADPGRRGDNSGWMNAAGGGRTLLKQGRDPGVGYVRIVRNQAIGRAGHTVFRCQDDGASPGRRQLFPIGRVCEKSNLGRASCSQRANPIHQQIAVTQEVQAELATQFCQAVLAS
jgi:hypothetical protein